MPVQYTTSPPMQRRQPADPVGGALRGLQAGQQLRGLVDARKKRNALMKIIGSAEGDFTREQLREIGKIDPQLAMNFAQLTTTLHGMETGERDMALASMEKYVDIRGKIAVALSQVPIEQRPGMYQQLIGPVQNEPTLRPYAEALAKDFSNPATMTDPGLQALMMAGIEEDVFVRAQQTRQTNRERSTAAMAEQAQASALRVAEENVKQQGRMDLEAEKQRNREALASLKESEKSNPQKVADLMREVQAATGERPTYEAAMYVITDGKSGKVMTDPDGTERVVDLQGNPIDLSAIEAYIYGDERQEQAILPKGSPALVGQRLRGQGQGPQPVTPGPTTVRRPRSQRAPDILRANPW